MGPYLASRHSQSPSAGDLLATSQIRPLLIAGLYGLLGILWIIISNILVVGWAIDALELAILNRSMDFLFVAVTSVFVFLFARSQMRSAELEWRLVQDSNTEFLLECLLASVSEAVLLIDERERMVHYANPAAESLFGCTQNELVGQTTEHLHVDAASFRRLAALAAPAMDRDEVYRCEYPMRKADGTPMITEISISALNKALGWEGNVIGMVRDISAQCEAELSLSRSEVKYRLLTENTLDVIWSMDMERRFTYLSAAAETQAGYAAEALIGKSLPVLLGATEARRMGIVIDDAIAAGPDQPGVTVETQLRRKDGAFIEVEIRGRVIFNSDGQPLSIQGASRDITERVLLQRQVVQAQKMESVALLAGGIAHDFNNLLTIILGGAEMALKQVAADDPSREALTDILAAGNRAATLTRQLLAYARREPHRPLVVAVDHTVEEIARMLRRLVREEIELTSVLGAGTHTVLIDPGQLGQILSNLVVNARDSITDFGRITISTSLRHLDLDYCKKHPGTVPGDYVVVAVTDDGSGMDAETAAHLCDPFYTTKATGEGTGLGMAIVEGIVKQNGGYIEVQSEFGSGTTISIIVPALTEAESATNVDQESSHPLTGFEKILLVEDEAALLRLATRMLEQLGYRVLAAGSPAEALALAAQPSVEFDLLITDVVMPKMNGPALADAIARTRPGLRVLFMSGYAPNEVAQRGIRGQGVDFMEKPFTIETLRTLVRAQLGAPAIAPAAV